MGIMEYWNDGRMKNKKSQVASYRLNPLRLTTHDRRRGLKTEKNGISGKAKSKSMPLDSTQSERFIK
jgi:hypothetical protein